MEVFDLNNHQQQQVQSTEKLFQPYTIHHLTLQSRIVMPAMGRAFSPDGVPGSDVAAYYRRRAENGVGLIITEGVTIDHPAATSEPRLPRFHGEEALSGWAEVVRQVHEAGGKIFPIWLVQRDPSLILKLRPLGRPVLILRET